MYMYTNVHVHNIHKCTHTQSYTHVYIHINNVHTLNMYCMCEYCVYILYVQMYMCVCVCALMGCAIVTGKCAWLLASALFNPFFDAVICMPLTQHTGCGLKVLLHQEAVLVGCSTLKFFSALPVR